jgi:hypothetical protein
MQGAVLEQGNGAERVTKYFFENRARQYSWHPLKGNLTSNQSPDFPSSVSTFCLRRIIARENVIKDMSNLLPNFQRNCWVTKR